MCAGSEAEFGEVEEGGESCGAVFFVVVEPVEDGADGELGCSADVCESCACVAA